MTKWDLEPSNCNYLKKNRFILLGAALVVLLVFPLHQTSAQSKVWLDKNHNETTKENGVYYRPKPKKVRKKFLVKDYYIGGQLYREGKAEFTTPNKENFNGVVTYYYKNGNISKKVSYRRGLKDGIYEEYYETGQLRLQGKYQDDLKEGAWKTYYKAGKIESKGQYSKGEKVGVWKTYYKNIYYSGNE